MRNRLYLLATIGLCLATTASLFADIPPSPEQKKKIEETPRVYANGKVEPLTSRAFSRSVGAGNAKIVIPKAVFDDLAAAVREKAGVDAESTTKKSFGIPPIALVFAGLALSGACLYVLAKGPRFRTVATASVVLTLLGLSAFCIRSAQANAGPPMSARPGKVTIEVSADARDVVIYVPAPTEKLEVAPPPPAK